MQEAPATNAVAELRKAAGLSQRQLADAIGLTDQTISNVERGVSVPSLETALAIARFLGVSVERVFLSDGSTPDVGNHHSEAASGAAASVARTRPAVAPDAGNSVDNPSTESEAAR